MEELKVEVIKKINEICWADCSTDIFQIDYEKIIIKIVFYGEIERYVTIQCNNYIGFTFVGHWDENIIEDINIDTEGELIKQSLKNIRRNYYKNPNDNFSFLGGGVKKFDNIWYQLNIKLIDGNIIKIVCESFLLNL